MATGIEFFEGTRITPGVSFFRSNADEDNKN